MKSDNYKITQYSVSSILNYVENSQIAIPEIQRPFVWKGEEVRALIDSLYEGYPIEYVNENGVNSNDCFGKILTIP